MSCTPASRDRVQFSEYWEKILLPTIVNILEYNIQGFYSINIYRGREHDVRVIDLMTHGNCATKYSELLDSVKNRLLPKEFSTKTQFCFRAGQPVTANALDNDGVAKSSVLSRHRYNEPVLGGSIGTKMTDGTATLALLFEIDQRLYRHVTWQLFEDGSIVRDRARRVVY
ncbi:hypothetical protein PG990_013745 [Apiospora arundinis]|uniref:Uncharacterized protein n=1 Tax=Apiospora arundinis TaxID=335852 RepID=A0ABR2IA17_9PEZI